MREKVQATAAAETHTQAGFLVRRTGGCTNPAQCQGASPKARAPRSLSPWLFGAGKDTQPWGFRAASPRWEGRTHAQRAAAIRRHRKLPSWPDAPLSPWEPCHWTQVGASEFSTDNEAARCHLILPLGSEFRPPPWVLPTDAPPT